MRTTKAIIQKENQILVLREEIFDRTLWAFPGGRPESGEDDREALKRELREELSCEAWIRKPLGHFQYQRFSDQKTVIAQVYRAGLRNGPVDCSNNPSDETILEARWMSPDQLLSVCNRSSMNQFIESIFCSENDTAFCTDSSVPS